jgi:DNA-binding LytR/AlgR family response regulator
MLRIAICDDEPAPAKRLEKWATEWAAHAKAPISVYTFEDPGPLLCGVEENRYDLIFLDIHLGGSRNGIALAQSIRRKGNDVLIAFVTNYMDYVLKGYEVRAFRYLLKPAARRDVFSCLEGASVALLNRRERGYLWRSADGDACIPFEDILYFEVFSHTVELHTTRRETCAFTNRISQLEEELPPFFVRCHRSVIVNIHHVFAIRKNCVELDNTVELPVSARRRRFVQEAFLRYRV